MRNWHRFWSTITGSGQKVQVPAHPCSSSLLYTHLPSLPDGLPCKLGKHQAQRPRGRLTTALSCVRSHCQWFCFSDWTLPDGEFGAGHASRGWGPEGWVLWISSGLSGIHSLISLGLKMFMALGTVLYGVPWQNSYTSYHTLTHLNKCL